MKRLPTGYIFHSVVSRPWRWLTFSCLFAAFFISFAPRTATIDNMDYFFVDDEDHRYWEQFKRTFPGQEFFIVAFEAPDIFSYDCLSTIQHVTKRLEEIEEVRKVRSLTNVEDMVGDDQVFAVRQFISTPPKDQKQLRALRTAALANPLYVPNLVSRDGRTASMVVFTYDRPDDTTYRSRLLAKVETHLATFRRDGVELHVAGWTATNVALSSMMRDDIALFLPLTFLVMVLTIYSMFKSMGIVALVAMNMLLTLSATFGFFGLSGIVLNNLTSVVLPSRCRLQTLFTSSPFFAIRLRRQHHPRRTVCSTRCNVWSGPVS
jgi:predicted RND superfamily exporter protein